jgi:hypothetical protein
VLSQVHELEDQAAQGAAKLQAAEQKATDAELNLRQLTRQLQRQQQECQRLQEQLEGMQQAAAEQQAAASAASAAAEQQLSALRAECLSKAHAADELASVRDLVAIKEAGMSRLQQQVTDLSAALEEQQRRADQLQQRLSDAEAATQQAVRRAASEAGASAGQLQEELQYLQRQLEAAAADLRRAEADRDAAVEQVGWAYLLKHWCMQVMLQHTCMPCLVRQLAVHGAGNHCAASLWAQLNWYSVAWCWLPCVQRVVQLHDLMVVQGDAHTRVDVACLSQQVQQMRQQAEASAVAAAQSGEEVQRLQEMLEAAKDAEGVLRWVWSRLVAPEMEQ